MTPPVHRSVTLKRQLQPDYINWYVALGLMVTLVWLYISTLRLIANLRR
ncbi:Bax inhibitor-1/YccA family membrane protein [Orrella daihaiensis]|uniref:Bax inhibitor-1/YccA family protein n=1 Tax=Orrella daihaiensis TaxID=2782176 RepID=A0ABY4ARD9_9BURK|nr:Bax inhibitor-1/YccA family protein [Orrella daihaiensis]